MYRVRDYQMCQEKSVFYLASLDWDVMFTIKFYGLSTYVVKKVLQVFQISASVRALKLLKSISLQLNEKQHFIVYVSAKV